MINLLPWREAKQHRYHQNAVYRLIIFALILCGIMIAIQFLLQYDTKKIINQTMAIRNKLNAIKLNDLNHHRSILLNKLNLLYPEKLSAIKKNKLIAAQLDIIANDLPNTLMLKKYQYKNKQIELDGVGAVLSDIHHYNHLLQQQKIWENTQIIQIHDDAKTAAKMDFSIRIK